MSEHKLSDDEALALAEHIDRTLMHYGKSYDDSLNDIYHAIRQWSGAEPVPGWLQR